MLDIKYLRENADVVRKATEAKGFDAAAVDATLKLDQERRDLIQQVEELRQSRNSSSQGGSAGMSQADIDEAKARKAKIKELEEQLATVEAEFKEQLVKIPNPSAADVKIGGEEDNEVIDTHLDKPEFKFAVRDHVELGQLTNTIDIDRGTKVAQSGYYYLKNEGALLELAMINYGLAFLAKKGFIPTITPNVAKGEMVVGCGFQARSDKERQIYSVEGEDLDLIATAEITLVSQHADEILDETKLPLKYAGFSSCYRVERGSYGKDVRGILRVHEFRKVEMVAFCLAENSDKLHEEFLGIEREIWDSLEIPYQVIKMASGDLGNAASRKYDLEAWMPSQNRYREVTSTSNTNAFQTESLKIRTKREGKTELVHSLNGTVFALGRAMIAIYENNQNEDGSIRVPKVLQPYMGGIEIIPVRN